MRDCKILKLVEQFDKELRCNIDEEVLAKQSRAWKDDFVTALQQCLARKAELPIEVFKAYQTLAKAGLKNQQAIEKTGKPLWPSFSFCTTTKSEETTLEQIAQRLTALENKTDSMWPSFCLRSEG